MRGGSERAERHGAEIDAPVGSRGLDDERRQIAVGRVGDDAQDGEWPVAIRREARRNMAFHVDRGRLGRFAQFGLRSPRHDGRFDAGDDSEADALARGAEPSRQLARDGLVGHEGAAVRHDVHPDDDIAAAQRRIEAAADSKTDRQSHLRGGLRELGAQGRAVAADRQRVRPVSDRRLAFESADEEKARGGRRGGFQSDLHAEDRSAAIAALQVAIAGERP